MIDRRQVVGSALVVTLLCIVAVGCGALAATSLDEPTTTTPPSTLLPPSTLSPGSAPEVTIPEDSTDSAGHTWLITAAREDSVQWTMTVAAGDLVASAADATSTLRELAEACGVDPERDALLPLTLGVDRTDMAQLSETIIVRVGLATQYLSALGDQPAVGVNRGALNLLPTQDVSVAYDYSGGPECSSLTDTGYEDRPTISVQYPEVNGGERLTTDAVMVLHDYRTSASPEGDASFLTKLWFSPGLQDAVVIDGLNYVTYTVGSVTGPGVVSTSSGSFFPIDGTSAPDCSAGDNNPTFIPAAGSCDYE